MKRGERRAQVLQLRQQGRSRSQIAEQLSLSLTMVRYHIKKLMSEGVVHRIPPGRRRA